jgi:Fur family transcriptional regulator, ferric uptake regulator
MSSQPATTDLGRVNVASTPTERFDEYLQTKGMRNTDQRRFLLEHVFRQHEHFDADQLLEQLPRKGETGHVSRPTVYRALSEFVDAGLLRKFEVAGRAVYEHDYGYPQHDHMHCTQCNKLIEFENEQLVALRDAVARDHRFRVTGHRFEISGVCEDCAKSRKRSQSKLDRI